MKRIIIAGLASIALSAAAFAETGSQDSQDGRYFSAAPMVAADERGIIWDCGGTRNSVGEGTNKEEGYEGRCVQALDTRWVTDWPVRD